MKLWIFSDLHLEQQEVEFPERHPDADVIVCAGDLCHADQLMDTLNDLSHKYEMPVVMVPGNHEYWSGQRPRDFASDQLLFAEINEAAAEWRYPCVILDDGSVTLNGVRFVGGTVWTDYRQDLESDGDLPWRLQEAFHLNPDHLKITGIDNRPLTSNDLMRANSTSVRIIRDLLREPFEGQTVVISHHLPHPAATPAIYEGSNVNYLYTNSSEAFGDLLESAHSPALWVCGHTHHASDVVVAGTRILCNPHGFAAAPDEEGGNNGFRWDLVVDV